MVRAQEKYNILHIISCHVLLPCRGSCRNQQNMAHSETLAKNLNLNSQRIGVCSAKVRQGFSLYSIINQLELASGAPPPAMAALSISSASWDPTCRIQTLKNWFNDLTEERREPKYENFSKQLRVTSFLSKPISLLP